MQEITFPNVPGIIIARLNVRLAELGDTARAYRAVPATRPARFVIVQRTGGPKTPLRVTERAQITVEAWDNDPSGAQSLAQRARAIINAMQAGTTGGATFYRIDEFSGPADIPDPDSLQSRYTWTLSMHVRATSIV